MRPFRPGFHGEPAYIFIRFGEEYKFNVLSKAHVRYNKHFNKRIFLISLTRSMIVMVTPTPAA